MNSVEQRGAFAAGAPEVSIRLIHSTTPPVCGIHGMNGIHEIHGMNGIHGTNATIIAADVASVTDFGCAIIDGGKARVLFWGNDAVRKLVRLIGFLVLTFFVLAVGYVYQTRIAMPSVAVSDVRQPETLVLGEAKGNHTIYGINIRVSGAIDGDATITLLLGGEPYHVGKINGPVDLHWSSDWYSDTAVIRYEPINVQSGNVAIHYRFHDASSY